MPELLIVVLIIAIVCVIALPQMMSSRRMFKFSSMPRQIASTLNQARQEAMTQRRPVTFRYSDATRETMIYGGKFGAAGAGENIVERLSGFGVAPDEIVYGRAPGAPTAALGDGTNLTALSGGIVEMTFQPDGSVIDASGNPDNKALFFYDNFYAQQSASAVSVLGASGRAKVWKYSQSANKYVE